MSPSWIWQWIMALALGKARMEPSMSLVDNVKVHKQILHRNDYVTQLFMSFAKRTKRDYLYGGEEFNLRKEIFRKNLYTMNRLNEFADKTDEERKRMGLQVYPTIVNDPKDDNKYEIEFSKLWEDLCGGKSEEELDRSLPKEFDWRKIQGVVSPVEHQGGCGSCWAFSTTGNIEGQLKLVKNQAVTLSEQELVDCDKYDLGCDMGLPPSAFEAVIEMGGLESDKDYPYKGQEKHHGCHTHRVPKYNINAYTVLPQDEVKMKIWLAMRGPISIGVNTRGLGLYTGGVLHLSKEYCSNEWIDHFALLVGYGVEAETPYWIIKNSWGKSWGEDGYFRLYRGNNTCGVAEGATSAIIF